MCLLNVGGKNKQMEVPVDYCKLQTTEQNKSLNPRGLDINASLKMLFLEQHEIKKCQNN